MVSNKGKFRIVIYRDGPYGPVFLDTAEGGGFTIIIQSEDKNEAVEIKGSEAADGQPVIEQQTQDGRPAKHQTLKIAA
ncbi:MAG TPA: hypothetical protein VEF04_06995 [Blastocatellia bacterium]|nr:hypothetical protein [Blastocatellia bacterium]